MTDLSDAAKAVAGGIFGFMAPRNSSGLVFEMRQSQPTKQMQAALDELVEAGVIAKKMSDGSPRVSYLPTTDCRPYAKWLSRNRNNPGIKIPITEPIGAGPAPERPTKMTDAQWWALAFIADHPNSSPATIGGAMTDRPGFKHTSRGQILHKSQGFGRLGARMMKLLEDKGLIKTSNAYPTGPTFRIARITPAGRQALTNREAGR